MKKFNNFKDSKAVSLDFTKIENEVSENIDNATKAKQKKYVGLKLNKVWRYALCIMLTCVVSVGSTLLISGSMRADKQSAGNGGMDGAISPFRADWLIEEYFDEFFFFSGGVRERIETDVILKTSIISETDKNTLKEYCNGKSRGFNIYFGVKDNKEIVVLHDISGKPYGRLVFENNLSYSYKSVVEKFEELSGEKLTQEFLKKCRYEEYFNNQAGELISFDYDFGGITMRFAFGVSDGYVRGYWVEYYTAIINDKMYIVTNQQMQN